MDTAEWIVYDRSLWYDFLLDRVLERRASRLNAEPSDVCETLLGLASGARGFIFHLDCTITERFPSCRQDLIDGLTSAGLIVINHKAVDLRKGTIQAICGDLLLSTTIATAHGKQDELLIVKTTLNCRGGAERRLPPRTREDLGLLYSDTVISQEGYRVMPRADVPAQWWDDATLTIERFVSNRSEVYYRVYVCGANVAVACAHRPEPIKKMICGATRCVQFVNLSDGVDHVQLDVPFPMQDVTRFLGRIGMEFGTLDVVRDDQPRFYIIDANTTPYWCEEIPGVLDHLRTGLYET